MGVDDTIFEQNVKLAFSKVKEHILSLEKELKSSKEENIKNSDELRNLKKELESLKNELKFRVENEKPSNPQNQGVKEVSSGNEGVYSFIHSFTKHSFNNYSHNKQLNIYSNGVKDFKQGFDRLFSNLSKQEFTTFLAIYQLEGEIKNVTYLAVARKLNLTEGCIRTYVSSLLKKGLPLMKKKYNNKQVFIYISPEFRSLNLKQKLIDTFYHLDTNQKTLQEGF